MEEVGALVLGQQPPDSPVFPNITDSVFHRFHSVFCCFQHQCPFFGYIFSSLVISLDTPSSFAISAFRSLSLHPGATSAHVELLLRSCFLELDCEPKADAVYSLLPFPTGNLCPKSVFLGGGQSAPAYLSQDGFSKY